MEITERELGGNLLLAAEAASRGWSCIVGKRSSVNAFIEHLPSGVVFVKSLIKSDKDNILVYQNAGNKIVSQDIEGLVYTTIQEMVDTRFDPSTVSLAEKIFFWGKTQYEAVKKAYPDHAHKFSITGSPAADIWRRPELHQIYENEVRDLKEKYGPYVIIPSAFGSVNHFMGKKSTLKMILDEDIISDEKKNEFEKFWSDYEDFLEKVFHDMLSLLPELGKALPNHTIIVRPHPSENHQAWIDASRECENIKVIFDGPVTPWLLGADVVYHWGCSTGIESYLLGRPVLTYDAISTSEDEYFNHELPNLVSIKSDTKEKFFEILNNIIVNPNNRFKHYPDLLEIDKKLSQWTLIDNNEFAEVNILNALETLDLQPQMFSALPKIEHNTKEKIWRFIELINQIFPMLKIFYPNKIIHGLTNRAYGRHKSRNVEEDKVIQVFNKICRAKNVKNIEAHKIYESLFLINPDFN